MNEPGYEALSTEIKNLSQNFRDIRSDIKDLRKLVNDYQEKMLVIFVSKEQFAPIKNIVYGMVAIILTSVIGAIIMMVIKK